MANQFIRRFIQKLLHITRVSKKMTTKVAVAGTGSVGGHIISALLATGQYKVVVISRNEKPKLSEAGADVKVVDYNDVESLKTALEGVHTIVSCLISFVAEETVSAQLNLLEAAKAVGVKRFAPCEYGYSEPANHTLDLYRPKTTVWKEVVKSGLEYTAFRTGQFLNYFAYNSPHPNALAEGMAGAQNFAYIVDIAAGTAEVPGTGDEPISMIATPDVAKFVAAAVGMKDQWPEELCMCAEVTTYNTVIREVERITGKKIEVKRYSREELEGLIETEQIPRKFYLQAMYSVSKGEAKVPQTLNEMFPDIKPITVTEFLEKWWGEEAQRLGKEKETNNVSN